MQFLKATKMQHHKNERKIEKRNEIIKKNKTIENNTKQY